MTQTTEAAAGSQGAALPKYRALAFGVTRASVRTTADGVRYVQADTPLAPYAHRMTDRLVLLRHRQMALLVLGAVATTIEQEFRQRDVPISLPSAFHFVHKATESHQRLLHLLVTVEPLLLWGWTNVVGPAVAEFLRGVVQAIVLAISHRVVIDRRLDEVSRDVPFVIRTRGRAPPLCPRLR